MPVDQDGNITTVQSVNVPTIQDVIDSGIDVIPLFSGGMARVYDDAVNGEGVLIDSNTKPMG